MFATCVVATYHAQDVVSAAMKGEAKNIDVHCNAADCRIDAWLMNPDRAFDGGIDDIVEDAGPSRRDGTSDAWSDALGCFQLD